jgi:hypothetical protein
LLLWGATTKKVRLVVIGQQRANAAALSVHSNKIQQRNSCIVFQSHRCGLVMAVCGGGATS